jgi:hypothetical protein
MRVIAGSLLALTVILLPAAVRGESDEEKPVQIVLHPAPASRTALKYQLLPPFMERRPGNAAVWWNRLPAERNVFFDEFYKEFDSSGRIGTWLNIPLGTPREKEYREKELAKVVHLLRPGGLYADMERAARFESCDWQFPIHEGNPLAITLPEVQHSRAYARLLFSKARLEVAEGKYDQAVRTLQTGYAEARHVGQGPFLVCSLVGVTIASTMSYQMQQFIQQPGMPNLYWALSTLPRPLVDFRPAVEAESNLLYLQFPELRDLDKKTLTPEEWRVLLERTVKELFKIMDGPSLGTHQAAVTTILALQGYSRAKHWLIEHGRSAAEVEAMPVAQVVLLYSVQLYDEISADQIKWFCLPALESRQGLEQASQRITRASLTEREVIPFVSALLPAIEAAKNAETRCEWTITVLRVFEAMRLYAADHGGRWPDRLSDIAEVPIPVNPCDGKPFAYERHGDKAILTAEKRPRAVPCRYEITLMPTAK